MVDTTHCQVCGANLAGRLTGTCGSICARALKYGEPLDVARVRLKLAERHPCSPNCPGWAVFNAGTDPHLEYCDDCWRDVEDPLTDDDLEVLPEAVNELALAEMDGDDIYDHPVLVRRPCKCGCVTFRPIGDGSEEGCSGCGEVRKVDRSTPGVDPALRLRGVVDKMSQSLRLIASVAAMRPKTLIIENADGLRALADEADEALRLAGPEGAVRRYLDVSTACVSHEDYERIEGGDVEGLIVRSHPYGCWVHVPTFETPVGAQLFRDALPTLMPIIEFARERGCSWINFDQDADAVAGLPYFDW